MQRINSRFTKKEVKGESDAFRRFRYQFIQMFNSDHIAKTDVEFAELYVHDEEFERAINEFQQIPNNAVKCVIGYTGIGKSTCIRHCFSIFVKKASFIHEGKVIFPTALDGYQLTGKPFDITTRISAVCTMLMEQFPDLTTLMRTQEGKEELYMFIRRHTENILEGVSTVDAFDWDADKLITEKLKASEEKFKYQYYASLLKFFISKHYKEIRELVIILDDIESLPDDFQEEVVESFLKFYECMTNTDYPATASPDSAPISTTSPNSATHSSFKDNSITSATGTNADNKTDNTRESKGVGESSGEESEDIGFSIKLLMVMRPHTYRRHIASRQLETFGLNLPIVKEHSVPLDKIFSKRFDYYTKKDEKIIVIRESWNECKRNLDMMNNAFSGYYKSMISKLCFYDIRKSLSNYAKVFANRFWMQNNRAKEPFFDVDKDTFDFDRVNIIRALACQEEEVFFDSSDSPIRNIFFNDSTEDNSILSLMVMRYFIKKTRYDYYGVDDRTESVYDVIQFWNSICGKEISTKVRKIIEYLFNIKVLRKSIRNSEDYHKTDECVSDNDMLYISPRGLELFEMLGNDSVLFEMLRETSWRKDDLTDDDGNLVYKFDNHTSNELMLKHQREVIYEDLLEYIDYFCEQEDDILNQIKQRNQVRTFVELFGTDSICHFLWTGVNNSITITGLKTEYPKIIDKLNRVEDRSKSLMRGF